MLIERPEPTAMYTLSVRTDLEAYTSVKALAENLGTSLSVLMRLAIVDLIQKQRRMKATTLAGLMGCNDASY